MKSNVLSDNEKGYIAAVVREAMPLAADTAIARAFVTAVSKRIQTKKNIIRETEDLLRAKEILEENVKENEERVKNIEMGIDIKSTASDIVCMAQNRLTKEQMVESRVIHLKSKIEKDKAKLELLEGALKRVSYNKYYKILELKYIEDWDIGDIADELGIDSRTVGRHQAKMLREMATKIYGAEYLGG